MVAARRAPMPSPDLFREQRTREGKFYCDICNFAWPMSFQLRERSGRRVCKFCHEPDGDETERDIRRATIENWAARRSAEEQAPPRAPDGSVYAGALNEAAVSAITSMSPFPIVLTRGGAAVPVVLTGVGFTASDAFAYGTIGITDAAPPSLVSSTEWDLSVQASGGMAPGRYKLTFNNDIWQAVFDVR